MKYGASDGIRQKFTGYQKDDETGLDFAEARMYENRHGRFTAVDPLLASGKSTNPQSFNRYVYCRNNPLSYVDKDGLFPTEVHNDIIIAALPGLSKAEQSMIIYGSALVDTTFGTGSWVQLGGNGSNPFLDNPISAGIIFDFPRTLLPSEAYMHAMVPMGMTTEEAQAKTWEFITMNINSALDLQNKVDSTGNILSLEALVNFGRAAHPMMDSISPTHRFFQSYGIPTYEVFDGETGLTTKYDWWTFITEGRAHKSGESNPTFEEKTAAITLLQVNFLTSFGRNAFERAVIDQATRDRIYTLAATSGLLIPDDGRVAQGWKVGANLPRNDDELRLLHELAHQ
nr:RHS repeat-associated core domain-containing protein [Planktothrix sp. FACHB-1355]